MPVEIGETSSRREPDPGEGEGEQSLCPSSLQLPFPLTLQHFPNLKSFFLMLFLNSGSAAASLSLDLSSPLLKSILALLSLGPGYPDSTCWANRKARGLLGTAALHSIPAR